MLHTALCHNCVKGGREARSLPVEPCHTTTHCEQVLEEQCQDCHEERVCTEEVVEECLLGRVEHCLGDLLEEMGRLECHTHEEQLCECPQLREVCNNIIR